MVTGLRRRGRLVGLVADIVACLGGASDGLEISAFCIDPLGVQADLQAALGIVFGASAEECLDRDSAVMRA
jgi:hypothetical protein